MKIVGIDVRRLMAEFESPHVDLYMNTILFGLRDEVVNKIGCVQGHRTH